MQLATNMLNSLLQQQTANKFPSNLFVFQTTAKETSNGIRQVQRMPDTNNYI